MRIVKHNGGLKRWLAVAGLVLALQFNAPPAHAQFAVIDVASIAQTIFNGTLTSLKSQIDNLRAILRDKAEKIMAQAQIDAAHREALAKLIAEIQNRYTVSEGSQACALSRAGAASDALRDAEGGAAHANEGLVNARGIGLGADATSAAARARRVNIACNSGVLGRGRYQGASSASVIDQMKCRTLSGDDAIYTDADMRISSVLNPIHTAASKVDPGALQYSMPKTSGLDKNGYMTFGDGQGNISSSGDELAFIAAYEFCDHLVPDLPTPTHGNHLTVDDMVNIMSDRTNTAARMAAADRCFAALRYRTACPAGSKDVFKSVDGTSCNDIQKAMCTFLKTPKPNGLGMDKTRPSLANCEQNGLSEAEYDRLLATRCHDASYIQSIHNDLNAEDAEHFMLYECPMLEATYRMRMDQERASLEQAVTSLATLRNVGASPDLTARPVGGNSGGTP